MGKRLKSLPKETSVKLRGKDGFETYYSSLFGARWEQLKKSLFFEPVYAEWKAGGTDSYFLDPASVFAALQLPLCGAESILDLCAAPGGKTLVLASRMPENAVLVSNERSSARKQRLSAVCASCLPEDIQTRVKISCSDGAKWCLTQTECYDRILLDVPCSSERHVIQDEKYLGEWSPARIKTLSMEQWALLSSAYRLLKRGGYLVYSTCALNSAENDGVIARLVKKFDDAEIVSFEENFFLHEDISAYCTDSLDLHPEKTEYGFHILPDVQNGCGPIWFSLIHKKV